MLFDHTTLRWILAWGAFYWFFANLLWWFYYHLALLGLTYDPWHPNPQNSRYNIGGE